MTERAPALALLHGFAASPFTWRKITGALEANHRVVALDRPWASVHQSVKATLDELDRQQLDRPVLVGHSAGAEVALATAAAEPDRVAALVLISPVIGGGPPAPVAWLSALPGVDRVAAPALRLSTRWMELGLRSTVHDRSVLTRELVDGYRRPLLAPGVAEAMWSMTRERTSRGRSSPALEPTSHPSLVIVGRHDRWATPLHPPVGSTVTIDECGHLPQEERPERVIEEILRFTAGL